MMQWLRRLTLTAFMASSCGAAWSATPCPPHSTGVELFSTKIENKVSQWPADNGLRSILRGENVLPYIFYGSPAYAQTSTVWIEVRGPGNDIEYCTGVRVGANWVLSAAHCLNAQASLYVGFGPGANGKGPVGDRVTTKVIGTVLPDGFNLDGPRRQPGRDIVLLKIGNVDICPEYKRPSAVLAIALLLNAQAPAFYAVGFGLTESHDYGEKRMTALTPVSLTCTSSIGRLSGCVPFREFIASDTRGRLNPLVGGDTCKGDSGGPLFIKKDGRMIVAGITSRGLDRHGNPSDQCGYGGIYSYVGANSALNWLASNVPDLEIVE